MEHAANPLAFVTKTIQPTSEKSDRKLMKRSIFAKNPARLRSLMPRNRLLYLVAMTTSKAKLCSSTLHKKITRGMAGMMIHDFHPYYEIPHGTTFSRFVVSSIYKEVKQQVESDVQQSKSKTALTTDMWASEANTIAYLGLSCHYLTANFELVSLCLVQLSTSQGDIPVQILLLV